MGVVRHDEDSTWAFFLRSDVCQSTAILGTGMVCAPQLYSCISSHRRYPTHPLGTILKTDINDADTVSSPNTFLVVAANNNYVALKMPHSFGYRARTRDMFKRGFKGKHRVPSLRGLGS